MICRHVPKGGGQEGHMPPQIFRLWHMSDMYEVTVCASMIHNPENLVPNVNPNLSKNAYWCFTLVDINLSVNFFGSPSLVVVAWPGQSINLDIKYETDHLHKSFPIRGCSLDNT